MDEAVSCGDGGEMTREDVWVEVEVGDEREDGGAGDADALGVVAAERVGVEGRGDGEGVVQAAEGVDAWGDVVLEERKEEAFAGLLVLGRVFVVRVVAVAVVAVVAVEEALKGAVGRDEEGVVVLCVAEQFLDLVVLVDQRGKLGRVVALLDQLVDGLVRGRVVVSSVRRAMGRAVRRMRMVLVVILLAGVNQGDPAVERALDALGDVVFERREDAVGIRATSPPGLDCIMVRSLRVGLD